MDPNSLDIVRGRVDDEARVASPRTDVETRALGLPPLRLPSLRPPAGERIHLQGALELVEHAARTIDRLEEKSNRFESIARSVIERSKQQIASLSAELADWRKKAETEAARAAEAERSLALAVERARRAEGLAETYNVGMVEVCESVFRNFSERCAGVDDELDEEALRELNDLDRQAP